MPAPTISTDMANVSLVVPSIHPLLGIETHGAVNHQPAFAAACVDRRARTARSSTARSPWPLTGVAVATDAALRAATARTA